MRDSALETLEAAGLDPQDFFETVVPGAFELPMVAGRLARREDVHAVLCFGLILKGKTEHDRHIATAVAHGLMDVGIETETPVLFGVLTCNTIEQAEVRTRRRSEGGLDKGHEVAQAAIEVLWALKEAAGKPLPVEAEQEVK